MTTKGYDMGDIIPSFLQNMDINKGTGEKGMKKEKSRIRETLNLSTDADSRTDTNFESLRDLSRKKKND